jgi:hypothetical protein
MNTESELLNRLNEIINKSAHKELCLYRWEDGTWRFMLGNDSLVMLGEVDGVMQFDGSTLDDVLASAEKELSL